MTWVIILLLEYCLYFSEWPIFHQVIGAVAGLTFASSNRIPGSSLTSSTSMSNITIPLSISLLLILWLLTILVGFMIPSKFVNPCSRTLIKACRIAVVLGKKKGFIHKSSTRCLLNTCCTFSAQPQLGTVTSDAFDHNWLTRTWAGIKLKVHSADILKICE